MLINPFILLLLKFSFVSCLPVSDTHNGDQDRHIWQSLDDLLDIKEFDPKWQSNYSNHIKNPFFDYQQLRQKHDAIRNENAAQKRQIRRKILNDRRDLLKLKNIPKTIKSREEIAIEKKRKKSIANAKNYKNRKEKNGGYSTKEVQEFMTLKKKVEKGESNKGEEEEFNIKLQQRRKRFRSIYYKRKKPRKSRSNKQQEGQKSI